MVEFDSPDDVINKLLGSAGSKEVFTSGTSAAAIPQPMAPSSIGTKLVGSPLVYRAVWAVGVLRPKFQQPQGRVFADELGALGTAFGLKEYKPS